MAKFRFTNVLKTMRVLWGALTASTLFLVVLAFAMRQPQRYPMESSQAWVMLALGVASGVASFVMPLRLHAVAFRRRVETSEGAFTDPAAAIRRATALGTTPFIVSMALSESVSLLGFVVAFLGGPVTVAAVLFACGTLLAAFRFPTRDRILGPFERAHNATFAASKGGEAALG